MIFETGLSIWIKTGLIITLMMISFVFIGMVAVRILQIRETGFLSLYIWGMALFLAVEELVYIPCFLAKANFRVYAFVFGTAYTALAIIGAYYFIRGRKIYTWLSNNRGRLSIVCNVIMVVTFALIVYSILFRRWGDTYDDTYYLAKAGEILKNLSIAPSVSEAADGIAEANTYTRADVSSLIVLFAFISKVSSLHYVIVARTVFSFLIILFGVAIIHPAASAMQD